jgi:N-acetylglutamate synthase and related acetyltransferases
VLSSPSRADNFPDRFLLLHFESALGWGCRGIYSTSGDASAFDSPPDLTNDIQPALIEKIMKQENQDILIDTNPERLDLVMIYEFLTTSYWSKNIKSSTVKKALENCFCFGVYKGNTQIGFARVISDKATFAYLSDVFLLEAYRGQGFGKALVEYILNYPDLQGIRRWLLVTRDAHDFYRQFGFNNLMKCELHMELFSDLKHVEP